MVTSGRPGEGALQVAANLAILLAKSGARALLVDTDLRKPRAQDEFGVDNGSGLGEYLAGESLEPKPIRPMPNLESLFMVTGGNTTSLSSDMLTSSTFHSLLLQWRRDFDYVVVIGSPLLVENAGMLLGSWVDATVFIAQNGQSRLGELKQIRDTFLRNKARIHGVVIIDEPHRSVHKARAAQLRETRYVYPKLAKQAHTSD
jgi:Mrp family chromosome partitioning ATPase